MGRKERVLHGEVEDVVGREEPKGEPSFQAGVCLGGRRQLERSGPDLREGGGRLVRARERKRGRLAVRQGRVSAKRRT
jgi:hypothetical protein